MNLSKLTAILSKYLRAFRYGDRVRPLRDWLLLISIAGLLLIGSGGWSFWLFTQISNKQEATVAIPAAATGTASLESVRTIFEKRAAERAHYISDYHFVDPSR
jgi:hypothetical protein